MGRAPRTPGQSLLTGDLVRRILLVSAVLLAGSFALFQWQLASGASVEVARTAAINVFVVVEMMYLVSCRSLRGVVPNAPNPWLLGGLGLMALLQVLITYTPLMNVLFHTAPLPLSVWLVILGVGAIAYVVVELDKAVWRWAGARRDGNDPGGPASSVAGVLHCLGRSRSTRVG